MDSLQGHLLIASPHLADQSSSAPWCSWSTTARKALGWFSAAPRRTIRELGPMDGEPCDSDHPFHVGGPVSGPVMAIHTDRDRAIWKFCRACISPRKRVYINDLVRQDKTPFRIFVSHSGWAAAS